MEIQIQEGNLIWQTDKAGLVETHLLPMYLRPKAVLKPPHSKRWRDCPAPSNFAKRLECVRFITAIRAALPLPLVQGFNALTFRRNLSPALSSIRWRRGSAVTGGLVAVPSCAQSVSCFALPVGGHLLRQDCP